MFQSQQRHFDGFIYLHLPSSTFLDGLCVSCFVSFVYISWIVLNILAMYLLIFCTLLYQIVDTTSQVPHCYPSSRFFDLARSLDRWVVSRIEFHRHRPGHVMTERNIHFASHASPADRLQWSQASVLWEPPVKTSSPSWVT